MSLIAGVLGSPGWSRPTKYAEKRNIRKSKIGVKWESSRMTNVKICMDRELPLSSIMEDHRTKGKGFLLDTKPPLRSPLRGNQQKKKIKRLQNKKTPGHLAECTAGPTEAKIDLKK